MALLGSLGPQIHTSLPPKQVELYLVLTTNLFSCLAIAGLWSASDLQILLCGKQTLESTFLNVPVWPFCSSMMAPHYPKFGLDVKNDVTPLPSHTHTHQVGMKRFVTYVIIEAFWGVR